MLADCDIGHREFPGEARIKGSAGTLQDACDVTTFGVTITFDAFEWDEAKNRANLRKHGLDFADAEEMFRGGFLYEPDTREDYGENRWTGLGMIRGRIAHVVFVERGMETVRVISLRKASRRECKEYEKAIQDRLEAR